MNKTTDQEGAEGIRTIFDLVARNRYREVLERIARNPDIVNFVNNAGLTDYGHLKRIQPNVGNIVAYSKCS